MEDIIALSIPIIGFFCLVLIVRAVLDSRDKRRFAETQTSEKLVQALADADLAKRKYSAQKWGLLFFSTGIGFIFIDVFQLSAKDPGAFGILVGAIGIGLLVLNYLQHKNS